MPLFDAPYDSLSSTTACDVRNHGDRVDALLAGLWTENGDHVTRTVRVHAAGRSPVPRGVGRGRALWILELLEDQRRSPFN